MTRFKLPASVLLMVAFGSAGARAEETLDTLLPPPGWLRRHAEELDVDEQTRQFLEELYKEKEPKYHQLKYKVERQANQLYTALDADELDEELIVRQMKSLLAAESDLKLYQVHVRISLLSQLSTRERRAARELAKREPPATNWQGTMAAKVERVRELGKRLADRGRPIAQIENRMQEIDKMVAAGRVVEGMRMLDVVVDELEASLE